MPTITLPDNSTRVFKQPVTILGVAQDIGPGLAKATLAGEINGRIVDADTLIDSDVSLRLITSREDEGLEVLRHSTAHLLAQAVKQLFPEAQVTIGPVIADGFYYDFAYERPFTPEDLEKIEARMKALVKQAQTVTHKVLSRDEAIAYFKGLGEHYKAEIIESIPEDEDLTLYTQGDFTDLCRGPHVPNTDRLGAFKLTKVAGAYWRGDSDNAMLQRIYGTAWPDKKQLKAYLLRVEEAKKRDHRKLGKIMQLFHMQDDAAGMAFWHENGFTLWNGLAEYLREKNEKYGFREVKSPIMGDLSLWQRSGHWDKYRENMYIAEADTRQLAVKPMNCPGHIQIYNQGLKSYRDLPIRLAEFGLVHRFEPSGALHGLMRARSFTQDDAHSFCTESQIQEEVVACLKYAFELYRDFGFSDQQIEVKLATRPEERIGEDAVWDYSEKALAEALSSENIDYQVLPGEGAFYGPKIEFHLQDCLARWWQCGTVQLDFSMPGRLGAEYVNEQSDKQIPVMIHRAMVGSMERFIAILIEHTAGDLPFWLTPVQAVVMGISEKHDEYVSQLTEKLKNNHIRARSDLRNEKIGYKIREHALMKVPLQLIAGDKELDAGTISVRTKQGKDLGIMTISDCIDWLSTLNAERQHKVGD